MEQEIKKYKALQAELGEEKKNMFLDYDEKDRLLVAEKAQFAKFKKEKEAEFKR